MPKEVRKKHLVGFHNVSFSLLCVFRLVFLKLSSAVIINLSSLLQPTVPFSVKKVLGTTTLLHLSCQQLRCPRLPNLLLNQPGSLSIGQLGSRADSQRHNPHDSLRDNQRRNQPDNHRDNQRRNRRAHHPTSHHRDQHRTLRNNQAANHPAGHLPCHLRNLQCSLRQGQLINLPLNHQRSHPISSVVVRLLNHRCDRAPNLLANPQLYHRFRVQCIPALNRRRNPPAIHQSNPPFNQAALLLCNRQPSPALSLRHGLHQDPQRNLPFILV